MMASIKGGTPKSSIFIGISLINHPFGVPPCLRKPPYIHIKGGFSRCGCLCASSTQPGRPGPLEGRSVAGRGQLSWCCRVKAKLIAELCRKRQTVGTVGWRFWEAVWLANVDTRLDRVFQAHGSTHQTVVGGSGQHPSSSGVLEDNVKQFTLACKHKLELQNEFKPFKPKCNVMQCHVKYCHVIWRKCNVAWWDVM